MKPTVVQFGAGAIGRGFLGQLWTEAGYEVVFVDVYEPLVSALNTFGSYPLHLVTNTKSESLTIGPVRAILASDTEAVLDALKTCAFAATAVGPGLVPLAEVFLLPLVTLPEGQRRTEPLNVLVCENDPMASSLLRDAVAKGLPEGEVGENILQQLSFIPTVIGRMVPVPHFTPGKYEGLAVTAEPYKELPVEAKRWVGKFPTVPGLYQDMEFRRQVQKKRFIHNAGHAVLAYHGYRRGLEFIYQCAEDPEVVAELNGFWGEINTILQDLSYLPVETLIAFEEDLLIRFGNRVLGDTVLRVGRDPIRKLDPSERLVWPLGAYLYQEEAPPYYILRVIAAALRFDVSDDPAAQELQARIREQGVARTFREIARIPSDDPRRLVPLVEEAYNSLV